MPAHWETSNRQSYNRPIEHEKAQPFSVALYMLADNYNPPIARQPLFFNDLNFQKIKINVFYKIILGKPGFGMLLKLMDRSIQPHGFSKIELEADVIKRLKDHSSSGKAVVRDADDGVFHDPGIFH